jgi:hypothetical protein
MNVSDKRISRGWLLTTNLRTPLHSYSKKIQLQCLSRPESTRSPPNCSVTFLLDSTPPKLGLVQR